MLTLTAAFRNPWTGRIVNARTLFTPNSAGGGANSGGSYVFQSLDTTLSQAQTSALATIVSLAGQLQAIKDGASGADKDGEITAITTKTNAVATTTVVSRQSVSDEGAAKTAASAASGAALTLPKMSDNDLVAYNPVTRGFMTGDAQDRTFGSGGADDISSSGFISTHIAGGGGADTFNIGAHIVREIYGDLVAGMDPDSVTPDGHDIFNIAGDYVMSVYGGGGNDLMNVTAQWDAWNVEGGEGDDVINLNTPCAMNTSGGKGDDVITMTGRPGIADFQFAKGDGHDIYNLGGHRARVDLLDGLTVKDIVTSAEDQTITITFADSDDSITINYAGSPYGDETPQVTLGSYSSLFHPTVPSVYISWSENYWEETVA